MTVGSFAVRAVAHDGRQLLDVAAIASGPAAALSLVKRSMDEIPAGTRFHVRGGAHRRPHDHNGRDIDLPFWAPRWEVKSSDVYGFGPGHDALTDIRVLQLQGKRKGEAWETVSNWGSIERFDEDPKDAFDEYRAGERAVLLLIAFFAGLAALQALRWLLS